MAVIKFVVKEDINFIDVEKNLADTTHVRVRTFLGIPIYKYEYTRSNTVPSIDNKPTVVGFKKK